jgi:predicted esterase
MKPHAGQPVLQTGVAPDTASGGAILVHGRGADARDILGLAPLIDPGNLTFVAPEAADHSWYPYSFLAPITDNEPGISSALAVIDDLCARLVQSGVPESRILLLGFSQGACLVLEYAARHARRLGGVVGLSGGLIGPFGTHHDHTGDLAGTPVFLGCSDTDPHIPRERVEETADVMKGLGARVTMRIYPGMGHGINDDEVDAVRQLAATMIAPE